MGYNTRYTLTQPRNPISNHALLQVIDGDDEEMRYALSTDGTTRQEAKWYEHNESMCALSARYPTTVFKLHGEGSDAGDIWHKFYCEGDLVFEDKLEPKLVEPDIDTIVPVIPPKVYTREDWLAAVAKGETDLGFSDWLLGK